MPGHEVCHILNGPSFSRHVFPFPIHLGIFTYCLRDINFSAIFGHFWPFLHGAPLKSLCVLKILTICLFLRLGYPFSNSLFPCNLVDPCVLRLQDVSLTDFRPFDAYLIFLAFFKRVLFFIIKAFVFFLEFCDQNFFPI